MMTIFGLDVGSSGCKCVAFSEDGKEICSDYEEYTHLPGTPNLCPHTLKNAVFKVIKSCVDKLENSKAVSAIAVSSFGESFVPLDKKGNPISDIVMYYVDSPGDSFNRVVDSVGPDKIMEITRAKPVTMYSLAKILPILDSNSADVWKFLEIADYIVWCLSGETVTDFSLATRTLLFDIKKLMWSDQLLAAAGVKEEMLATPMKSGSIAGKLSHGAAAQLGLEDTVNVVICGQDQVTNAIGAGVFEEGDAVDGNGTVECITPIFKKMPELEFTNHNYVTVPYLDEKSYVTYAFNFTGGALLKWYRASFGIEHCGSPGESFYDYMNRMCPEKPSDIIVVPHFQGAGGTPDVVREAKGIICGLDLTSNSHSIYRALLEGLSFEMKYNLETINRFGIHPKRIFASGGGAKSAQWLQIKADIWDCEIIPLLTEEAGAQGAAIMAAATLNKESFVTTAKRFIRYGAPVKQSDRFKEEYEKKYNLFKSIRGFSLSKMS